MNKKYKVIYADPPWEFNNKNTGGSMSSGSSAQYNVMKILDLQKISINEIADDNCVLCMWWVGSQPQEAIDLAISWGFTIKTMTGFVWEKRTKNNLPFFGMGFWTRAGAECCLIATKGKPKPVSRSVRSVRSAKARRHSEKPDEFRDDIVELCGDVPRIELFARKKVAGWESFGNEVESDIEL